jgi:hypothetical protein
MKLPDRYRNSDIKLTLTLTVDEWEMVADDLHTASFCSVRLSDTILYLLNRAKRDIVRNTIKSDGIWSLEV